jgi:hypothetical protein
VVEDTDPATVERHRQQDERHRRNLQWLQAHWEDLPERRGRYVAVADEQAFVAETAEMAWDWARSQHPDDDGGRAFLDRYYGLTFPRQRIEPSCVEINNLPWAAISPSKTGFACSG